MVCKNPRVEGFFYFEKNICNIASAIAQNVVLKSKCHKMLGNNSDQIHKSFYFFMFWILFPSWYSASHKNLKLLEHALNKIKYFFTDILINLEKCKKILLVFLRLIIFYIMLIINFIAKFRSLKTLFALFDIQSKKL